MLVLRELMDKHPVYVFSYRGNPIKELNTKAWRKALERAGEYVDRMPDSLKVVNESKGVTKQLRAAE